MNQTESKSSNLSQKSKRLRLSSPLYKSIISETPLLNKKPSKYKKLKFPTQPVQNHVSSVQEPEQSIYLSTSLDDRPNRMCDQRSFISGEDGINITVQNINMDFETVKHEINPGPLSEELIWTFESSEEDDIIEKITGFESSNENCTTSIVSNTIDSGITGEKSDSRRRNRWSKESTKMNECLKDMDENNISARRAAHNHGVKLSELLKMIEPNSSKAKRIIGPDPTLTEKEEEELVEWMRNRDQSGFPVRKIDLIYKAAEFVQDGRPTRFKDGIPGDKWFLKFLSRHPNVVLLGKGARSDSRQIPTKRTLKTWFKELSSMLSRINKINLLKDPSKLGSVDELGLCLNSCISELDASPQKKIVFADESCGYLNTLVGACADGDLMPPLPVFSCRRPTADLVSSIPNGWGIGICKDGKIDKNVVHNYLKNILLSWLRANGRLPFILFVDKLKEHMTMDILDYCAQNGLLIHNFYPNSQNIIQPLKLMLFQKIEHMWKSVTPYKTERDALLAFSPTLKSVLNIIATPSNIRESFKRCGIFPFNDKSPDYRRCPVNKNLPKSWSQSEYNSALDIFEDIIGEDKALLIKQYYHNERKIKAEDASLYQAWLKLNAQVLPSNLVDCSNQDYHHEKLLKNKVRIISRPETRLKVLSEEDQQLDQISSFGSYSSAFTKNEHVNSEVADITQSEIGISIEPDLIDILQEEATQCVLVDVYRNFFALPKDSEQNPREPSDFVDFLEDQPFCIKTESICHVCCESTGEMLNCISCAEFFHFTCLVGDEQEMVSFLMQQSTDFDYLCLGCSGPDLKKGKP